MIEQAHVAAASPRPLLASVESAAFGFWRQRPKRVSRTVHHVGTRLPDPSWVKAFRRPHPRSAFADPYGDLPLDRALGSLGRWLAARVGARQP